MTDAENGRELPEVERREWCSWSGKRMASPSGYREKCPGCGQMVLPVSGFMCAEFENHRVLSSDDSGSDS